MCQGSGQEQKERRLEVSCVTDYIGRAKGQKSGNKLGKEERLNWAN